MSTRKGQGRLSASTFRRTNQTPVFLMSFKIDIENKLLDIALQTPNSTIIAHRKQRDLVQGLENLSIVPYAYLGKFGGNFDSLIR